MKKELDTAMYSEDSWLAPASSVANLPTENVPDGAFCWVDAAGKVFQYRDGKWVDHTGKEASED